MKNKKLYIVAMIAVFVFTMVLLGELSIFGFLKYWGTIRIIAFVLVVLVSLYLPIAFTVYLYTRNETLLNKKTGD